MCTKYKTSFSQKVVHCHLQSSFNIATSINSQAYFTLSQVIMLNRKSTLKKAAAKVFKLNAQKLKKKYLAVTGHSAANDGYHTKPVIKAILFFNNAGVLADLHAKLLY